MFYLAHLLIILHVTYQTFNVVLKYHLCMSNDVSTVEVICAVEQLMGGSNF